MTRDDHRVVPIARLGRAAPAKRHDAGAIHLKSLDDAQGVIVIARLHGLVGRGRAAPALYGRVSLDDIIGDAGDRRFARF
ncbi:MAG: hypothetical protein HZY79_15760 [Rhodoblastus sp.]|nr:MAG: hypothetical protein HZY79_15760 [Rhodoblastus sp.]